MKKLIIVLFFCFVVLTYCMGYNSSFNRLIQPYYLATPRVKWTELGSISASQSIPAGTARDYSDITDLDATKIIVWNLSNQGSGGIIRAQTSADADADVLDMWVIPDGTYSDGTTEDHFLYGGQITLTGGTQTGPNSNVFCDIMTFTDGVLDGHVLGSGGDSLCAVLKFDAEGYKKIVFTASTLESGATIYVDGRTY